MTTIAPPAPTTTPPASSLGAPVNPLPYRSSEPRQPSVADRLRNKIQDQLDGKPNDDFDLPDGKGFAPVNTAGAGKLVSAPPPFKGGQMVGVQYCVEMSFGSFGTYGWGQLTAPISALGEIFQNGYGWAIRVTDAGGERLVTTGWSVFQQGGIKPTLIGLKRIDGQPDTGGDIATPKTPVEEGYDGDTSRNKNKNAPPIIPPSFAPAVGWGTGKGVDPAAVRAGLGLGVEPNTGKAPTTTPERKAPPPAPNPSTRPAPTPSPQPPSPNPSEKPKSPVPSNPEAPTDNRSIMQKLIEVAAILGFINANTQPDAQRVNAKNGTCDAMQSPSCTQGFENRIKDPINQNIDAKTGLLAANQAGQDVVLGAIAAEQQAQKGVLATIATKATDIFNLVGGLWNNGIVDKAMQYITMITVIHNAAMLTRGIADTLGSALDLGLQAFGLQIRDKDGNQLGVNQVIGKSFENLIKGIIGADNYTALTETWVQANRIYQTGINLISNVQNILDSTTAVAELTSNRVGTLMNALRNSGMVRENAYGAQSQNVTRFNAFQNKLEALEQGVSNTASIAGNIVSVQQSVNEIKSNRQEFENALKDKPVGAGATPNTPEIEAELERKAKSLYTISDFSVVKPPETP